MRLRARLALLLVASAMPIGAGAVWLRDDLRRRDETGALASFARARMEAGGREICERAPDVYQEPPPGFFERERRGGGRRMFDRHGDPSNERLAREEEHRELPRRDPPELAAPPESNAPRGAERDPAPNDGDPPRSSARDFGHDGARDGRRMDPVEHDRLRRAFEREHEAARHGPRGLRDALPQLELWAYASEFVSANARAPAFPADVRAELESGASFASVEEDVDGSQVLSVGVRMEWSDGPCALVLLRRIQPPETGALAPISRYGPPFLASAGVVLVALLALGPIVRRVRALEGGVRRSAQSGYALTVPAEGRDEIADLAHAFNAAGAEVKAQLERVAGREKALREFVENTTHDVMIPLTVVQSALASIEGATRSGATVDPARAKEALEEVQYLAALLENLAAAAALDAREMPIADHPISLNQLVERVASRYQTLARARGVELVHALPGDEVETRGDVTLVERALSNVVQNAVRYGESGGHAAIVLESGEGRFVVRVLDDGPGVAEDDLDKLVQRSWRGDAARSRHQSGQGLGLSITQDVCARHGFELRLVRREPRGLEVRIEGAIAVRSASDAAVG